MDIILRVKRNRDEKPLDIISLSKKPKTIENMLENLNLGPNLVFKRIPKHENVENINTESLVKSVKDSSLQSHLAHSKQNRLKVVEQWRNKIVERKETIYCDGEPLVSLGVTTEALKNLDEIDEYILCESNSYSNIQAYLNAEFSDSDNDFPIDDDSEDSNRESHPYNDYPDESSEDYNENYDESEEYEDYEVE
jgi:hypothetical protein